MKKLLTIPLKGVRGLRLSPSSLLFEIGVGLGIGIVQGIMAARQQRPLVPQKMRGGR